MREPFDHPLWRFSLRVYAAPGVEEACLRLQDRYGANVNLILFCCWFGHAGYGEIGSARLSEVLAPVRQWHDKAVAPLRALRRVLKQDPLPLSTNAAEPVRQKILDAELSAEQALQTLLFKCVAGLIAEEKPAAARRTDSDSNLAAYLATAGIHLEEAVERELCTLIDAAFKDI